MICKDPMSVIFSTSDYIIYFINQHIAVVIICTYTGGDRIKRNFMICVHRQILDEIK
jgi:hypothetical protein